MRRHFQCQRVLRSNKEETTKSVYALFQFVTLELCICQFKIRFTKVRKKKRLFILRDRGKQQTGLYLCDGGYINVDLQS